MSDMRSTTALTLRWFFWLMITNLCIFWKVNPLVWLRGVLSLPLNCLWCLLVNRPENQRAFYADGALSGLQAAVQAGAIPDLPKWVWARFEKLTADAQEVK